jgi:putative transposase
MVAAQQLAADLPLAPTCAALGVSRASYYRRQQVRTVAPARPVTRPTPPRALTSQERQTVRDTLHSTRFVDRAPAEVYATLLDENTYLCSIRTMYRILHDAQEVRERRDQLRHPRYQKPELLATAPNQVWSWDITKLLGPAKWTYFYLYVILDVFSRYVVGWLLAQCENADLARRLIRESCDKQGLNPQHLTIHSDRGPAMRSQCVAQLLATLGITKSHSRPHVSNDNPFSESQFKTLKYRPEFPNRFNSQQHGLDFCRTFFPWYNDEHHHWGLGLLTPAAVHFGQATQLLAARQRTLTAAYRIHPERFVRREPKPLPLPTAVWINPPTTTLLPQDNPLPLDTKFDRQVSQTH